MSLKARKCTVCYEEFETYSSLKEHWMVHLRHLQQDDDSESEDDSADGNSENIPASSVDQDQTAKDDKESVDIVAPLKCPRCEYSVPARANNSRRNLKEHLHAKHLGIKNHACPHCKFRTSYQRNLATHLKSAHLGKKTKKALKASNTTSGDEESLECTYCDYQPFGGGYARRKIRLQEHLNGKHLGIKDKKCSECKFRTSYTTNLRAHVRTRHLGIKNLKCSECDFRTSYSKSLRDHLRAMHPEKKIKMKRRAKVR